MSLVGGYTADRTDLDTSISIHSRTGPPWPSRKTWRGSLHFVGPLAVEAFNAAGGEENSGDKVPLA